MQNTTTEKWQQIGANTDPMLGANYLQDANKSVWDLVPTAEVLEKIDPTALEAELTMQEKQFIVDFLAGTISAETEINAESLADEKFGPSFARIQDPIEVAQHYIAIMETADYDSATYTASTEKFAEAIYSYDTEYRESIVEQFMYACLQDAQKHIPAKKNMLTLPARLERAW